MTTHRTLATLLALAVPTLGSCVTQQRYDEVLRTSQHYQRLYHDLQQFQAKLEADNQSLQTRLDSVGTQEAGYTAEIDERMAELQRYLTSLGASADDVTRFEIDGGYGYSLRDAVLFDSGSAQIRPEGKQVLLKLAGDIAAEDFARVWVRGHTDGDPVKKPTTLERFPIGNLQLSAARAVEVAGFLMGEGKLGEARLAVAGLGSSQPVAPNDSATNKQRNRRVEILVLEDA